MRKWPRVFASAALVGFAIVASPAQAQEAKGKGGLGPCLGSCLIGPRVGPEMNEGKPIDFLEWVDSYPSKVVVACCLGWIVPDLQPTSTLVRLWLAYDWGYKAAGAKGFLASCCIGPRVGREMKERKVRTKEKLLLVPIVNLYPWISMGLEAYSGKTMSQIEQEENLRR